MTEVRVTLPEEIDRYLDSIVRTGPFSSKAELVRAALVAFADDAGPMARGFDAENVIAPDGRVYQLEYAREASLRGSPGVGIVFDGGVVLAAATSKRKPALFRELRKIERIGERLAVLSSGLIGDAYMAVRLLRETAPKTTLEAVDALVQFVWSHTIDRTKRPLAASFLLASSLRDEGRLFYVDPSGAFVEYFAAAIGEGSEARAEQLESRYRRGKAKEAEKLAIEVLGAPEAHELVRLSV
jgi:20S proteasome alpha/beta subunit